MTKLNLFAAIACACALPALAQPTFENPSPTAGSSTAEKANATADKAKKDLVEAQNAADSLIHSTEKALAEHGDKVGVDEKSAIETGLTELKAARDGTDPEDIRTKTNTLVQASRKLGEAMYAQNAGSGGDAAPADDGVVDAEFEEVSGDDDQKKSA